MYCVECGCCSGELGKGLVASMTMGSGQFCTKPGVVFVPNGPDGDTVVAAMEADLMAREPNVLLNQGLKKSLDAKVAASRAVQGVREAVATQDAPAEGFFAAPRLFVVDASTFFASPVYWTKQAFVVLLLANGYGLVVAERLAKQGKPWTRLAIGSASSLFFWFVLLLMGTLLTVAA